MGGCRWPSSLVGFGPNRPTPLQRRRAEDRHRLEHRYHCASCLWFPTELKRMLITVMATRVERMPGTRLRVQGRVGWGFESWCHGPPPSLSRKKSITRPNLEYCPKDEARSPSNLQPQGNSEQLPRLPFLGAMVTDGTNKAQCSFSVREGFGSWAWGLYVGCPLLEGLGFRQDLLTQASLST